MLPVVVLIRHGSPVIASGTLIFPVVVLVLNVFSESRVPFTLPVLVSMAMSAASQALKVTSPVLRLTKSEPEIMTFFMRMSPVVPFEVILLQVTFMILLSPVVVEISIVPAVTPSM